MTILILLRFTALQVSLYSPSRLYMCNKPMITFHILEVFMGKHKNFHHPWGCLGKPFVGQSIRVPE